MDYESEEGIDETVSECGLMNKPYDDDVKYFKNDKANFVGQPDFILKNIITNEIIVIEEKYQFIPSVIEDYSHNYYDATKAAEARITYDRIMEGINEKRNKNY